MQLDEFEPSFRATCNELLENGRALYDSLCDHMRKPCDARPLDIEIVDNPALNAKATSCNETFKICIFRGAIEHIYGTMYGLMSCSTFLPEIGNTEAETKPTDLNHSGFRPLPILRARADSSTCIAFPSDPLRGTVAMLLATVALDFLLCHEIGHIVAGHIGLRSACGLEPSITEYQSGSNCAEDYEFLQVLECDADAFACHTSSYVNTQEKIASAVHKIVNIAAWGPEQAAYVIYLAAVAVLFRVFYPWAPVKIGAEESTHPHPAVRACVVSSCAAARCLQAGNFSPADVALLFRQSVRNVEDVWADLRLSGQNPEPSPVWAESVGNGVRQLLDSYAKNTSVLEQYAHIDRRWHDWEWRESAQPP